MLISIPKKYVPKGLNKRDKEIIKKELKKSRKLYKKKRYHTRKNVQSYKSKVSKHIVNARKIYKTENIKPSKDLANFKSRDVSS